MEAQFLINNSTIAYLIHGQPLCLEYRTKGYWFVVIAYNNGDSFFKRLFFRKSIGKFETVTNFYSPEITLWGIGWGIKKLFHKRLRINFFNPITQTIRAHTPELPFMPKFSVSAPRLQVHQQQVSIKSAAVPRLLHTELNITAYDDYSNYKSNYNSNNTIN